MPGGTLHFGQPEPAPDLSTWEGRMAARARARRDLALAAEIADANPYRLSPTSPPGEAFCCAEWRRDGHVGADRSLRTFWWQRTCEGRLGCDHAHHVDEVWLAATADPDMISLGGSPR